MCTKLEPASYISEILEINVCTKLEPASYKDRCSLQVMTPETALYHKILFLICKNNRHT